MPATAPIIMQAAEAAAAIVNAAWAQAEGAPVAKAALRALQADAAEDETDGLPAAYVFPVGNAFERAARKIYARDIELAIVILLRAEDDEEAANGIALTDEAAAALLDAGTALGGALKFESADVVDVYDQPLLQEQGVFRSQCNVRCTYVERRP